MCAVLSTTLVVSRDLSSEIHDLGGGMNAMKTSHGSDYNVRIWRWWCRDQRAKPNTGRFIKSHALVMRQASCKRVWPAAPERHTVEVALFDLGAASKQELFRFWIRMFPPLHFSRGLFSAGLTLACIIQLCFNCSSHLKCSVFPAVTSWGEARALRMWVLPVWDLPV